MRTEIDVSELIDTRPVGGFQIFITALCAATLFMEGFDSQGISYAAPAIIREWGIPAPAFAGAFAAGLTGTLTGVLCLSTLADYVGRRVVVLVCTIMVGVFTLLTPTVHDIGSLTLLRVLTGFALGGTLPTTAAITAEYSPRRLRALFVTIMVCGIGTGAAAGGPIAAQLIPRFGWQALFHVGGVFPLVLAVVLYFWFPESPRFLALKSGRDAQIGRLVRRMYPQENLPADARFVNREERSGGFTVRQLFGGGRTTMTLLIWSMFVLNMLTMYLLRSWLPTVFSSAGFSVQRAALTSSVLDGAGILGTLAFGWLIDRYNACRVLACMYLAGGVFTGFIGYSIVSPGLVVAAVALAGVGLLAAQNAVNAVVLNLYPTSLRSTSIGWAIGIGRIGSIVGPLLGGGMIALHWDVRILFLVSGLPALGAAVSAFVLSLVVQGGGKAEYEAVRTATWQVVDGP
jgi:MFS transporter, AAHS family, 4-hydroxybenzoate transporter